MVYINSSYSISPVDSDHFKTIKIDSENSELIKLAKEPIYKSRISPKILRRMSKILKMSLYAVDVCLEGNSGSLDGVMVGTGSGNLEALEKFLLSTEDNTAEIISPTPFMQSTNNVISSQIAIQYACKGYNISYSNRAHSFEWALQDALMRLEEFPEHKYLVGGADIFTESKHKLFQHLNYWKTNYEAIVNAKITGTYSGEGAAFFTLSNKKDNDSLCSIQDLKLYNTDDFNELKIYHKDNINAFNPDVIILGLSGDIIHDQFCYELMKSYPDSQFLYYKHLTGEYETASAYAMWLGAMILKHQYIPEVFKINAAKKESLKSVLIYNHFRGCQHSFIALDKA